MKKITLLMTLFFTSSLMFGQVLAEDFEGGGPFGAFPPTGWTNNEIAPMGGSWVSASDGDAVGYNSPNTILYDNGLLAGTYALFNSDALGNDGNAENTALESPSFDVSTASNVLLSFNHFFTAGYGGQGFVEVFNGTTWIEVANYTGASQTDSSFGLETIDVSTELTGVANAQVRFRWTGDWAWGWAIDNIVVTAPSCVDPAVSWVDFSTTTADITIDITGDFELEWGEIPYTQGSGGNTATISAGDSYQFTNLTPGVSYDLFVRQNCGADGFSNWVEAGFGTSPDLSTLPYNEDFEFASNQNFFVNKAITFAGTGVWNFSQDDLSDGDDTNDFANSGVTTFFSNNTTVADPADAIIFVGPFPLTTANEYIFSFQQRTLAAAEPTRPAKDFDIVVAATNDGMGTSVLGSFDDVDNVTYTLRTGSAFNPPADGDYYFGIHDRTDVLAGVALANTIFVDDLSITSQPLSIDEFDQNSFTHFYNKSLKTLNISSETIAFTGIEIYSVLGKSVVNNSLTDTSVSIDVSALNDGVYLAKINTANGTSTFKFVKN